VLAQVGQTDPKNTLEVYAQVLKRRDRTRLGQAFDTLMRDAIPSIQQAKALSHDRHSPIEPLTASDARGAHSPQRRKARMHGPSE
jgi:hypothetical protein